MLNQLLLQTVKTAPDRIAIVDGDKRLSYRDLYDHIASFSRTLQAKGIDQGDCVMLVLPNSVEYIVSFLALAKLNAIVLPLSPLLKGSELAYYLQDSQAKAIITDTIHAFTCYSAASQLQAKIEVLLIDEFSLEASGSLTSLVDSIMQEENRSIYQGDALYQYTSGSTGKPKRVCRTQQNLFAECDNFADTAGITSEDIILCVVPLHHAHGLGNCLLLALRCGAKLVILEQLMQNNVHVEVPFGARCARVLELIETEKVSVFPGVPHIFKALAEAPADPKVDTSSLRFCFSGGNFLEVNVFDLFMRRFGVAVRQMYGCTEAGSVSINREVQGARFKKSSVGQPVKGVEVKIVDELKNELLAGKIGEIAIKGLALTAGYSNVVNGDIANFKESWFFTGDLGKKDKEGFIYIIGRKRTFIDTGGYKVDPAEIEDVLAGFPGVAEAVVVGIEVPGGEELIKAVIVPSGDCDAEAVRAYCEEKLADFKIPRMIEFRRELPRNPMGKVLKKDLLNAENIPAQTEEVPADLFRKILLAASRADLQTCLETYLREQCARLLKLHPSTIDARQRLSDLGLTSVTSIELSTRITLDVKQECSPGMIWNYPTIALLAAYLAERIAGIAASKATQATQEPQGQE